MSIALSAAALLVVGCTSKGPAPGEPLTEKQDVVMAERTAPPSGAQSLGIPTKDFKRDYAKTPHDPHGPAGHLNPPGSHVSGPVSRIDAGGLTGAPIHSVWGSESIIWRNTICPHGSNSDGMRKTSHAASIQCASWFWNPR